MRKQTKTLLFLAATTAAFVMTATAKPAAIPDAEHVANGCFLSATRYIAANGAGRTATVTLPSGSAHTIAIVDDADGTWGRDEFIGVFAIRSGDTQRSYNAALKTWLKRASSSEIALQTNEVVPETYEARLAEVRRARELLGVGDIVVANTKVGKVPALIWRSGSRLCCYEPTVGTIVAESTRTVTAYATAALTHALGAKVNETTVL